MNYHKRYKKQLRKIKARCHRLELCRKRLREFLLHYIRDDGMCRRLMHYIRDDGMCRNLTPTKPVLSDELTQKMVSVTKV